MAKVIGALFGLVAAAVYVVAATELLRAETGVDVLAPLRGSLPPDLVLWVERAPLEASDSAPSWRLVVMGIAVGAGAFGSLLLIAGSRLSATLLWLAFLLLAGVLVGQDLVLANGIASVDRPQLIALGGALGLSLLFAAIANAATAPKPVEDEGVEVNLHQRAQHVRDLLRTPTPAGAKPVEKPAAASRDREPAPHVGDDLDAEDAGAARREEPPIEPPVRPRPRPPVAPIVERVPDPPPDEDELETVAPPPRAPAVPEAKDDAPFPQRPAPRDVGADVARGGEKEARLPQAPDDAGKPDDPDHKS